MYTSQKVASNYIKLLESKNITPIEFYNEDRTSIPHLAWMLTEIVNNKQMSETKTHRWLGFVQGCLIKEGILTVDEERNATRSIFNGE